MKFIFPVFLFLIVLLIIIAIDESIVLYLVNIYGQVIDSRDISSWGAFGDFWGGVLNPIFSFISIIFIIYTVLQQGKAIEQTNTQIQLSMKEVTKSVAAQEKQAELSEIQLRELTERTQIDEIVKVLNNLISDLKVLIDEEFNCYSNRAVQRSFRSQLLDLRSGDKRRICDFLKVHNDRYIEYKETFDYSIYVLNSLQNKGDTLTYNYYERKIKKYQELILKGEESDI